MLALMSATAKREEPAVDEDELARLKRDYLPMWAALAYGSAVGKGVPTEFPFIDYMKGGCMWGDEGEEEPDPWVCNIIEAGILEISGEVPLARAALSVRYLNARGPSVYRSGRIEAVAPGSLEDIADQAERMLVPITKRRGLPL